MRCDGNRPPDDPVQSRRSLSTFIKTELLIEVFLEKSKGLTLDEIDQRSEVLLLRSQVGDIEHALRAHPHALENFRKRLACAFAIIDKSVFPALEVYRGWHIESLSTPHEPDVKWPFAMLFRELDVQSRLFLARVRVARGQALLTNDQIEREFARLVGLQA